MREVYACRLPLADPGVPAFERALDLVVSEIRGDIGLSPAALDTEEGSFSTGTGVSVRWHLLSASGVEDRLWTLRCLRPHEDEADLVWCLTVDVALENGRPWVGVRLGLRPTGHRLLPVRLDIRPPAIAGALVDGVEVVEDGWRLSREPAWAIDDGGVQALAELLLDRDRVLPVVVVTPVERYDEERDEYRTQPLVDADDIGATLVGLAHVAVVDTEALTYGLTDLVGRQLSVFGGAVRLYWPELDDDGPPAAHPLWLPDRLGEPRNRPLSALLLRRLAAASTFRVSSANLDARLRAAVDRQARDEIARLFARARDASLAPEWQAELERAWSEADRLREENAELAGQLAVALDNLRAISRHAPRIVDEETSGSVLAPGEPGEPRTLVAAVQRAGAECPHLVFLGEAMDSARRAAYRQPGRLYGALLAMEEVADDWGRGQLPSGFRDAFAARGFEFAAHVSPTALGRFGHEYERRYEGRTIAMGPHLALGRGSPAACCRIYFHLDEEKHLFVVGHVGNHLSDTTSG